MYYHSKKAKLIALRVWLRNRRKTKEILDLVSIEYSKVLLSHQNIDNFKTFCGFQFAYQAKPD